MRWGLCIYYVCSFFKQGCSHDRGTSNAESYECGTGALLEDSICNGSADTAYGWRSPAGTFRTVMAYFCQPGQCDNYQGTGRCARIPYFSGDYSYRNGETLGGEKNNCRKKIMKNKRKIAAYRWAELLHSRQERHGFIHHHWLPHAYCPALLRSLAK